MGHTVAIEWRLFLVALGLLTRLPLAAPAQARDEWQRRSVRHNPAVGLVLGSVGALVLWAAAYAWPATLAVMLGMVAPLWLTSARDEAACIQRGTSAVDARALVGLILALAIKLAVLHGLATRDLIATLALMPLAQAWAWAASVALPSPPVADPQTAEPALPAVDGLTRGVAGLWVLVTLAAAVPFVAPAALLFAALAAITVVVWAAGRPQRAGPVARLGVELAVLLSALAMLAR